MDKELIILAIYINVDRLSRTRADQVMHNFVSMYTEMYKDINKDVKVYWFPSKTETRVECVYPPPNISGSKEVIENELLKIYKMFLNFHDEEAMEVIRNIERKLKLSNISKKSK